MVQSDNATEPYLRRADAREVVGQQREPAGPGARERKVLVGPDDLQHHHTASIQPKSYGVSNGSKHRGEKGVRLAQKMQVGPCTPAGIQLQKAGVGPTSGPTWRLSHLPLCLNKAAYL